MTPLHPSVKAAREHAHSTAAGTVALTAVLFAAISALRFAVTGPAEGIGFLYVIPISILGGEFGWRVGTAAAAAAFGLTAAWMYIAHVSLGVVGLPVRGATFVSVGLLVGLQAGRRRRAERQRGRLMFRLQAMASEDQLTGLPNRRAWDERFLHELQRAARSGDPLSLVAIDLDNLKLINDGQGHQAGDALIRTCAAVWSNSLRDVDFIARLGGDEFFVLLPDCLAQDAKGVMERVKEAMPPGHLFSAGVAQWDGTETGTELIRRADEALYTAKHSGRGRVELARGQAARPVAA